MKDFFSAPRVTRLALTLPICYFIFKEAGTVTAVAIFVISLTFELHSYAIRKHGEILGLISDWINEDE